MIKRILLGEDFWFALGGALLVYFLLPAQVYQLNLIGSFVLCGYSITMLRSFSKMSEKFKVFQAVLPDQMPPKIFDEITKNVEWNITISVFSMLLGAILLFISSIIAVPKVFLAVTSFIVVYGLVSQGLSHDFFERNIKVLSHVQINISEDE